MPKPKSPSHIEISQSAIVHNLNFIRSLLPDDVRFCSVVKGNAYGHGIEEFCKVLFQNGVQNFCTYSADEAYRVWQCTNGQANIIIMGHLSPTDLGWAIENGIEFFVYERSFLEASIAASKTKGQCAKIHLEIETGMNRTGIAYKDLDSCLRLIKANDLVVLQGVCSHLAGAESISNYYRIKTQKIAFTKALKRINESDLAPANIHLACSAALLRYPESTYNMVRIGILQYGFFPSKETLVHYCSQKAEYHFPLKRAISWKSQVMSIKTVKSGEFVGYGTSFFTNTDTKIAVVPAGYALGFSRRLSNQGKVLLHGKRVPVIGTVNMNALSIDISELDDVKIGDEVVLIGQQGDLEISVASFSDYSALINYELLTRLPLDIPRTIVD